MCTVDREEEGGLKFLCAAVIPGVRLQWCKARMGQLVFLRVGEETLGGIESARLFKK